MPSVTRVFFGSERSQFSEPGSIVLISAGMALLGCLRRRMAYRRANTQEP